MGVLIQCELCKSVLPEKARYCAQCGSALRSSTASIIVVNTPETDDILSYPGMQDALMLVDQLQEKPVIRDPRMALAADVDEVMLLDNPDQSDADDLDDAMLEPGLDSYDEDVFDEELFSPTEGVDPPQEEDIPTAPQVPWLEEVPSDPQVSWLEEVPSEPEISAPLFNAIGQMGEDRGAKPRITVPLPAISQEALFPPFPAPTDSPRSALRAAITKGITIFCTLIIVIVAVAGLLLLGPFANRNPSPPMLSLSGVVVPGEIITIHGRRFLPASKVTLAVDGAPLAYTTTQKTMNLAVVQMSTFAQGGQESDSAVIVKEDGTFEKPFLVPPSWLPGSDHTIRASEDSKTNIRTVQLDIKVEQMVQEPTPTATVKSKATGVVVPTIILPTPTPTPIPPCIKVSPTSLNFIAIQGQGAAVTRQVTLINCGGPGNWIASVNANSGGNWLKIGSMGGILNLNANQSISIAASATNLLPGKYMGKITFKSAYQTMTVNVSFTVAPKPCVITVSPQGLSYTMLSGGANPAPQTITITSTNCNGTSWTANSSSGWIGVSQAGGTFGNGTSQAVTVAVTGAQLKGQGQQYHGSVTISAGKTSASIGVTLDVQPAACVQASNQQITLTTTAGSNAPTGQAVTITNCGGPAIWTAAVATNDGGNWLGVGLPGGTLAAGGGQAVPIIVASAQLPSAQKPYTGHITFTITANGQTSQVTVNVVVTVQALPTPTVVPTGQPTPKR